MSCVDFNDISKLIELAIQWKIHKTREECRVAINQEVRKYRERVFRNDTDKMHEMTVDLATCKTQLEIFDIQIETCLSDMRDALQPLRDILSQRVQEASLEREKMAEESMERLMSPVPDRRRLQ